MASLIDITNSAIERKKDEFLRILIQAIAQWKKEHFKTAVLNEELEGYRKFENSVKAVADIDSGKWKPGMGPDSIPYNICTCKDFATKDMVERLKRENVEVLEFQMDNQVKFMVHDSQMPLFDRVVAQLLKERSNCTIMHKNQFDKTYSEHVKYTDFDDTKLKAFENYVQGLGDNAFAYAVCTAENGKKDIYIPKSVYNDFALNIDGEIKNIHRLMSGGLLHQQQEMLSQRKSQMIDKLIDDGNLAAVSGMKQKKIYVSSIDPRQFVEIEGKQITVHTPDRKPQVYQEPFDMDKLGIELYSLGQEMNASLDGSRFNTPFVEVPKDKFYLFEGGVVSNREKMEYAENERLSSNFSMNKILFNKLEEILENNNCPTNARQLIIDGMKEDLKEEKNAPSEKLLKILNQNKISDAQIKNMFETGSCVEAGIGIDISSAGLFDKTFEDSLSKMIQFVTAEEHAIRNKIGDVNDRTIDGTELLKNGVSQQMIEECKKEFTVDPLYAGISDAVIQNALNDIRDVANDINERDMYSGVMELGGYDSRDGSLDDYLDSLSTSKDTKDLNKEDMQER